MDRTSDKQATSDGATEKIRSLQQNYLDSVETPIFMPANQTNTPPKAGPSHGVKEEATTEPDSESTDNNTNNKLKELENKTLGELQDMLPVPNKSWVGTTNV